MSSDVQGKVRDEIVRLHVFFVGWFAGSIPKSSFEPEFLSYMSDELVCVPPAGNLLELADLATGIRDGYGSNPDFRIAIREVRVHSEYDDYVLATYEEWQRNARASKPPDNGRIATVLFKGSGPFKWLHLHETWMPADKMAAGPFDF